MPPDALAGLPVALAGIPWDWCRGPRRPGGKIILKIAIALLIANLALTAWVDHLSARRDKATRCLLYALHNITEPKACTEAFPGARAALEREQQQ
jgi:hypothetical protein